MSQNINAASLINLTPHAIHLMNQDNQVVVTLLSSGSARVAATPTVIGEVAGFPLRQTVYGEVQGLPEPEEGVFYIVSAMVAARCTHRNDVLIPDDTVRDEAGRIIGCRALGRV